MRENGPKRDDSWDQISPLFAELGNSEEIKETNRRSARALWVIVCFSVLMFAAFSAGEWLWGAGFYRVLNVVAQVGGVIIIAGLGILGLVAVSQKDKPEH